MAEGDVQQRARQLALAMRSQMVLSGEDEEVLWWLLQRHAAPPTALSAAAGAPDAAPAALGEPCLNYDAFSQVAAECREAIGPSADLYFQASTFLRLARDVAGCVPAGALFRYCVARSAQIQLRAELGVLDAACSGALSPAQLEGWLQRHAPLAACSEALVSDGDWCTAVGARLLLLHCRRGRLPIKELAGSPAMHELSMALHTLEAAEAAVEAAAAAAADSTDAGLGASALAGGCSSGGSARSAAGAALAAALQQLAGAWFSPGAAAALRQRFTELDADGDGRLSQQEFAGLSQGTMTRLAIDRIFAQHCPGGSGMDFPAFCTFCAAWEARHHPAAVRYFFAVLDLQGRGYLAPADLYTFFREVHALWVALGQYAELRVEDVLAEVLDLLRTPTPSRVSPTDLQRCGAAGTIIGLLLDVNLFWEYENREVLLQQQQQQQQAGAGGGEAAQ